MQWYLKLGVGEAWAGQFKLCGREDVILNELDPAADANLGAEEPIGSKKIIKPICLPGLYWDNFELDS